MASILAVGFVAGGSVHLRVAPLLPPVTDADLDALIDEVYGKPGLGVEDSAGLFDLDDEPSAYDTGRADYTAGRFAPPTDNAGYDAYVRGYNDAWADSNNVAWWRRGERR